MRAWVAELVDARDLKYHLQETPTGQYSKRTEKNVLDSDGILILSHGLLTGGSALTREFAKQHRKPWIHILLWPTYFETFEFLPFLSLRGAERRGNPTQSLRGLQPEAISSMQQLIGLLRRPLASSQ